MATARESPVGQEAPPPSPVRDPRSRTGYSPRPHWPPASGPASGHLQGTPGRIQYRGDSVPRLACRPSIDDAPVLSAPGGDVLLDSTQSAAARAPSTQLPRPARALHRRSLSCRGKQTRFIIHADDRGGAQEGRFIGTHNGTLRGPAGDIPATGRSVDARFCGIYEFDEGKITSCHLYFDQADMMMQLGLTPEAMG